MKDKKQESENSTPRINSLREIGLEPGTSQEFFPTLTHGMYQALLVLGPTGSIAAYLAMEVPEGPSVGLHLYIPKDLRTKENIMYLTTVFFKDVHPWIKSKGKDYVIVTCDYKDDKTKELFKTFGFDPSAVWMGFMPV